METPLTETEVRELNVSDIVYLTGTILTARDKASARILELIKKGKDVPINLTNSVLFHAGPIVKKNEEFELLVIGPTTSARMNKYQPDILKLGVRAIIGKGGMDSNTLKAMRKYGSVYLAATGGCAVVLGQKVKRIKKVYWLDLGIPDAIWELEVKDFGPLVVAMDSHGHSLYDDVKVEAEKLLASLF